MYSRNQVFLFFSNIWRTISKQKNPRPLTAWKNLKVTRQCLLMRIVLDAKKLVPLSIARFIFLKSTTSLSNIGPQMKIFKILVHHLLLLPLFRNRFILSRMSVVYEIYSSTTCIFYTKHEALLVQLKLISLANNKLNCQLFTPNPCKSSTAVHSMPI